MLTPTSLKDYIGQERVKQNLQVVLDAQLQKTIDDPPMDHVLLSGPAGLGKTSLAQILANELGRPLIKLLGPHLDSVESLSFLLDTKEWTFVFIDEIHSLPKKVEEALYEPMDEFKWQGKDINSFTLIGATTKEGLISKPLRSRFTITEGLLPYDVDDISEIIQRSATILGLKIDDEAVEEIALRSRGTPRVANQLLKRVSYYSQQGVISSVIAQKALDSIGVDEKGLEVLDRGILKTISRKFKGGPVGKDALANVMGEDITTIESRETYLVQAGFVKRTTRGRVLTKKGKEYVRSLQ